ncbi:MAG TPA: threonine dehydratase [Acidobacteriota bacterium]|nr:threonine dehydratase [Acidobacteriota bacterium]
MSYFNIQGVFEARPLVYRHLKPTPLLSHPLLDAYLGTCTLVKHENHNPTGSFKIRGGLNYMARLSPEQRQAGVVTATRGNHGQSVALAARINGVKAVIVVPHGNNPEKNAAMKAYGAELIEHGRDYDEARELVEEMQDERGMLYVHSANAPHLVHGVGTYTLEILQDLPKPDYIFVPLGGGSGTASVLTVVRAIAPKTKVVGVQAEQAPAIYQSWKKGEMVTTDSADTIADGLATRVPFEMTFEVIRRHVDDIVTISEEEIKEAIRQYLRTTHNLAEGAAAAPLAAAYKLRSKLRHKSVVLIHSGANIDSALLREILAEAA